MQKSLMAARRPTKPRPAINYPPENNPQAVIRWSNLASQENSNTPLRSRDLSLQAKKHLLYLGWRLWYVAKQGKWELRYTSPITNKNYVSLITACQACIQESFNVNNADYNFQQNNVDHPSSSSAPKKNTKKKPRRYKKKNDDDELWPPSSLASSCDDDGDEDNYELGENSSSINGRRGKNLPPLRRVYGGQGSESSQKHHGRRTIITWLIDHNVVDLDSLVYCHGTTNNVVKKGKIVRGGIVCDCCDMIFSATRFETHAGCYKHKPSATIFLEDGRSLLNCKKEALLSSQQHEPNFVEEEEKGHLKYKNDSFCLLCGSGGSLVLCDGCPHSFHIRCSGLDRVPDGKWFCPRCCCKTCNLRCCSEDCADNEGVNGVIVCHQCERKCHVGCLTDMEKGKGKYVDNENCFCSGDCENIFFTLQKLVGKPIHVGADLTWTLLKSVKSEDKLDGKLSVALGILSESFGPIPDAVSGTDMLPDIVFSKGSEINRPNYRGFYTVVLEKDEEVVSVATLRILGKKLAELPFICTRIQFRKLGMCRVLVNEIEKQLTYLGVEYIVLPSTDKAIDTWTDSFGFAKISLSEKSKFLSYVYLEFEDTTMCHKSLLQAKQIVT